MEGVGESCCHCVPPGEWVWGAAEEVRGRTMAGSQRWLHQVPGGGGGTGYPSLRVRGAWVVEAGQGRGPLGGGGPKTGPQSPPASSDLPHEVTLEGTFLSLVTMGWIWFLSCSL